MQKEWQLNDFSKLTNRERFFQQSCYNKEIQMLEKEDSCLVEIFNTSNPSKVWQVWATITSISDNTYTGFLDDDEYLESPLIPAFFKELDAIEFTQNHIKCIIDKSATKPKWFYKECWVSSLAIDNWKIGYMKKYEPLKENKLLRKSDSGWCFYEGSEDLDFLRNPRNFLRAELGALLKIDEGLEEILNNPDYDYCQKHGIEWHVGSGNVGFED